MSNLIPFKTMEGVEMTKVKGIGAYYYPTNNSKDHEDDAPAQMIMWIHGGGRIAGSADNFAEGLICSKIVLMFGVPVLAADYRKPSKHPFPAALDDIHRAYHWLVKKVGGGGRIVISGLSAGGGLAAELCQRLLDETRRGEDRCELVPLPVCQLLIDPMLDDRTCVNRTVSKLPPHILWNAKSNLYAWSLYLGPHHQPGSANLPKYASASRRECLSGLPPALVLVGDLDLFHEECTKYAHRLKEHGVETEFVVTEGGYHAFMSISLNDGPSVECWDRFHAFGKRFLFDQVSS
jgi:acetyl esterase/lipase